jgi:hypothetical protein
MGASTFARALMERLPDLLAARGPDWRTPEQASPRTPGESLLDRIRSFGRRNFTLGIEGTWEAPIGPQWPPGNVSDFVQILANHLQLILAIARAHELSEETLGPDLPLALLIKTLTDVDSRDVLEIRGSTVIIRPADEVAQLRWSVVLAEGLARTFDRVRIVRSNQTLAPSVMAAFGYLSSCDLGKQALDLLTREIVREAPIVCRDPEPIAVDGRPDDPGCELEKIKVLINLLKSDHLPDDRKEVMMAPFFEMAQTPGEELHRIRRRMPNSRPLNSDCSPLMKQPWRKMDLMMDLIGLALSDQRMNPIRAGFIQEIGVALGFSAVDLDWLLDEEVRAKPYRGRRLNP